MTPASFPEQKSMIAVLLLPGLIRFRSSCNLLIYLAGAVETFSSAPAVQDTPSMKAVTVTPFSSTLFSYPIAIQPILGTPGKAFSSSDTFSSKRSAGLVIMISFGVDTPLSASVTLPDALVL